MLCLVTLRYVMLSDVVILIWYDMILNDMIWYDNDILWYAMRWYEMIWYEMMW